MKNIILAIGAHPDDIEFFAGGTIEIFTDEGKSVFFIITTDGQRGSLNLHTNPQQLIKVRKYEARAASQILGVKEVIFLGYEDGFLDNIPHLELREKYIYYIRKLKPDIVLTFDPWNPYEPHSDHRKTALAAFESCYFSHYPLFHPETKLKPHFVSELWLFRSPSPNTWIPLKNVRKKVKALLKHKSQMQMLKDEIIQQLKTSGVDTTIIEQLDIKTTVDIFVRRVAEAEGKEKGYKFAETFKVFKLGYVEDVKKIIESLK
ncbi:MAG: PIG-L deacetylase family protein [Candidatus Helarchaeota archaeon]